MNYLLVEWLGALDGLLVCSSFFEVGKELGVEDSVTFLNVVDFVHGKDAADGDDREQDSDPEGSLAAGDATVVIKLLHLRHIDIRHARAVSSSLSESQIEEEQEAHKEACPEVGSSHSQDNNLTNYLIIETIKVNK